MNLETKVKKLGLLPLDDEKRYELAIDKERWHKYKEYDYYKESGNDGQYFYSEQYLNDNSYRELKKKWKECSGKTFKRRLESWMFRLDIRLMKLKHKIRMMF